MELLEDTCTFKVGSFCQFDLFHLSGHVGGGGVQGSGGQGQADA